MINLQGFYFITFMTQKEIQQKIQEIANKIAKEYRPEKIILFGSYAWGKPGPDSDVDLFIIKETENTRRLASEIDGSIFPRHFAIDILVYKPNQAKEREARGDFFIKDILTNGKLLYGAN